MRRRITWLAAGAAALGLWRPGWLTAAGLDAWNAPALRRQLVAERAAGAELDGELAGLRDDIRVKTRLSDELAAGRLTPAEATDQFGAMAAAHPRVADGLRQLYPDAATDRERAARHVADFLRWRLAEPAQRDRARAGSAGGRAAGDRVVRHDGG